MFLAPILLLNELKAWVVVVERCFLAARVKLKVLEKVSYLEILIQKRSLMTYTA
jgi:hypothetical protein